MVKNSSAVNNFHEITKKQQKGIDIISQLPDELLIRILSLLPDADVTRSRILSNSWKHLWAFLPNLHLVIPKFEEQANKYIDSVDQTLALCGGTPIKKLFLQSSYPLNDYRVNKWLREAEELEFRFYTFDYKLYWNIFRSCTSTLIKLTLQGFKVLLKPQIVIRFPCLKEMILQCIEYFDTNSLMVLLSKCPVLEELCLDRLGLFCKLDMVIFSLSSMRRLTIKETEFKDQELVIDAPKLEYLHFMSFFCKRFTLVNHVSLVEAHISNRRSRYVIQLLRCVSSTKLLTLTRESLLALGVIQNINMPVFPNLIKLEMAWEPNMLLVLLNNMPKLEYLTFSEVGFNNNKSDVFESFRKEWNPPMEEEASACLRFKLKEILVVSYVTQKELVIMNYLLKHANMLENLTIAEVEPHRREPWLNIHRASKSSRIEFV